MIIQCLLNLKSYAMKNAIDEIKKIATYVTETNNNDGVGKA